MSLAKTLPFYVTIIQLQNVQQLYELTHEFRVLNLRINRWI